MKTMLTAALAVAFTTTGTGWVPPALSDEPFELTNAQLDHVAAGTPETVGLNFSKVKFVEFEFSLTVQTPSGQELTREFTHTINSGRGLPR